MARVVVWAPGDRRTISGELRFRADGASLRLIAEPDGCGMASGDMVGQPYEMAREAGERSGDASGTGDWREVRMVAAGRAFLHSEPGRPAPRAPTVTALDPVVILERRADWVRALYLGGASPVAGWLRAGDLAPADPPAPH